MRDVPVLAVDIPSLNEQRLNVSFGSDIGTIRGLTMYQCATITNMVPDGILWNALGGIISQRTPSALQIEQKREVTAVLVLFGMPRDLTASILAHEAMHVLLKLTPSYNIHLPPICEEGLCQVIAASWLSDDSKHMKDNNRDIEVRMREEMLRRYFYHSIEVDKSPIYGEGYRRAKSSVDALGLHLTLEMVAANADLPNV
jgi:hypothetical protein